MQRPASRNLYRTLIALALALISILVVAPLLAQLLGISNLPERLLPTPVARVIPTRTVEPTRPAPTATLIPSTLKPRATNAPARPLAPSLNGVPLGRIVVLNDAVREHIRDIYAKGQALGRNPRAFSKVGDSTMVYPAFLTAFDSSDYRLASYSALQTTIDFHSGSFARISAAVKKGMHTWTQFDPEWAPPDLCRPDEGPLECEVRLNNPSIALIRLGANDTHAPEAFEANLKRIVKYCLDRGIIPVLGTKPDQHEGPSNTINNLIRRVAVSYSVPLWDYEQVVSTVPGRGLEPDGIHMRGGGTHDYSLSRAYASGDSISDLTALIMLDAIRRELNDPSLGSQVSK